LSENLSLIKINNNKMKVSKLIVIETSDPMIFFNSVEMKREYHREEFNKIYQDKIFEAGLY